MLAANLQALAAKHDPAISDALTRNAVFFAVPLLLLGEHPALPADVQQQAEKEVARINAHQGRDICVTGAEIDYTQFIPRGHYTRSEDFKQYFRAMMWYGLVPMNVKKDDGTLDKAATLQALLITEQLRGSAPGLELWQQLYDPTVFYVGKADDLSYYQYGPLLDAVFGAGAIDRFADDAKLAQFAAQVAKQLPGAGIENYTASAGLQGKRFRFHGPAFHPRFAHAAGVDLPEGRHPG